MLEVKMGTDGFSNSGNEGSDDNQISRSGRDHEQDQVCKLIQCKVY